MFDIETYAMCKKLVSNSSSGGGLTEEQALAAVKAYFNDNPGAIVTNDELTTILADYLKTADLDLSGKQDVLTAADKQAIADLHKDIDISGKQDILVFNTAYDAETNKVATMADITAAINNLPKYTDLS